MGPKDPNEGGEFIIPIEAMFNTGDPKIMDLARQLLLVIQKWGKGEPSPEEWEVDAQDLARGVERYIPEFQQLIHDWEAFEKSGYMTRGFTWRDLLKPYRATILHLIYDFFKFLKATKEVF